MSLWLRLAVVMAFVSIAPLVWMGSEAIRIASEKQAFKSEQGLAREADYLATLLETWVDDQAASVDGWAQVWDLRNESPAHQLGLLRAVHKAMRAVVTVALVDEDGFAVVDPVYLEHASESGRALGSPARADRLVASDAIDRARVDGVAFGSPFWGDDGPLALPVAARVGDSGLVLAVDIALAEVAAEFVQETDRKALWIGDGERVVIGDGADMVPSITPLLGTNATFRLDVPGGEAVRGAVAGVRGTGWTIAVVEPAALAERPAEEIRSLLALAGGVAMLLVLFVGVFLQRFVSQPVRRLRDHAIAVSEGDFGRRMQTRRADELGELAQAFNHMSERLQRNRREIAAQQREIESFNRDLQRRVDERTRDLREAQERLVESGQLAAVAEVGAGLAHELNNPLAGILGLTQILRSRVEAADQVRYLDRIEEQAQRCREVVSAMVRFASGEVDPAQTPVVDLAALLDEVVGLVRGPFRQRGVALELASVERPLHVRLDPVLGARMFAQILNSLRAGLGDGATVTVRAGRVDGQVVVDLAPDRPVAVEAREDDWRASGFGLWVGRHLIDQAKGSLVLPRAEGDPWRVVLPEA